MNGKLIILTDPTGRIFYSSGDRSVLNSTQDNIHGKNIFHDIMTPYSRAQLFLTLGSELMGGRNSSNILLAIYNKTQPKNYRKFEDFACSCFKVIKANVSKIYLKIHEGIKLKTETQIDIVTQTPIGQYKNVFLFDLQPYHCKIKYQDFMKNDPKVLMQSDHNFPINDVLNVIKQ